MNSPWCQPIVDSIEDDSKWKASIYFPSTIWEESDFISNIDDRSSSSSSNEESNSNSTKPPEAFEKLFTTTTISDKVKQIDIIKLFDCNITSHKIIFE
jgi:hypothetical protein